MDKLILIDGNSLINRAYFALPPLNNPKGEPANAVYGFCTMLLRAITDYNPTHIAVAFDLHAPTFRHKMYSEYKAGRRKMPDDLRSQIPILKHALKLMGIKILELETYEADDIIGTIAKRFGVTTYILTGDRDSFQLIDDKISVFMTRRGLSEIEILNEQTLKDNYRLTPAQVIEYKGLAGDSSDNIPGVPGIGDKTATSMLEKFGDIDTIYNNLAEFTPKTAQKLIENKSLAYLSKTLATIDCHVPIECGLDDCAFSFPFSAGVKRFFIDMAFKSLFKKDELFVVDDGVVDIAEEKECLVEKIATIEQLNDVVSKINDEVAFYVNAQNAVSFSLNGNVEYVISCEYNLFDVGITFFQIIECFSNVFADPKTVKYVYDGKGLMYRLKACGATIVGYHDIKLMQFLSDQLIYRDSAEEYFAYLGYKENVVACGLYNAYSTLKSELSAQNMLGLYENVELPLEKVLFDMEQTGVCIDREVMDRIGNKLRGQELEYTEEIYKLAGRTFNINSPKQLASVLFEELAIPYPKRDKKHSTNAEVLELIKDEYPIADYVLKYRLVSKLNYTYVEGMRKLIDNSNRVHTEYKQTLTATGRLSSVEPNLQNIPVREQEGRELRAMFVAGKNKVFVSADYSQIELRLMAHLSQDPTMMDIYNQNGDIHKMTAGLIFGVPVEEVTEDMRRKAKTINFGVIYGMSDFGLASSLKCSNKEAKQFIKSYFTHFSAISHYFEKVVSIAKETGYVSTLFGRRRKIPELVSSNFMTRSFGERVAMNTPLQGSAADIIKIAMLKVYNRLEGMKSKLILQIHDELIIEADINELDEVRSILKECMENAVQLSVPLTVSVSSGKSWLDC